MSPVKETLESIYITSSDEDNLDWDSQASLKSLSPGPIACSRASHQRGSRLLSRQEIPGGGPVFWGDASGRSGIGYEKRAVHGNTTPKKSRGSIEGPVARPLAKFPTVPPMDGIVIQCRKASDNAPTQPLEPRLWELRSNSKRQQAKYVLFCEYPGAAANINTRQLVQFVHTPSSTNCDEGASLSNKNNERDANDQVPQRKLSKIVILHLRKKSLIVTLRLTKQKYTHLLQALGIDVDNTRNQPAVDWLTTGESNPYSSGKKDSSHDETSVESGDGKQQTRKRRRITPNSIYNETALEDPNDFMISTPDTSPDHFPPPKADAAGLFYPSPASIRSTTSRSTQTTQQSPIVRAVTSRSMAAETTEVPVHAENDVEESSVNQIVRRDTADRDLIPSTKTRHPPIDQVSPFELGYPLFVVTGDKPLELLRQESRSGTGELYENDFALDRQPIGNRKRLAGASMENDSEQRQTRRPKPTKEQDQDQTTPAHGLTAVIQAEKGCLPLTPPLTATGVERADLRPRKYGKPMEKSSGRPAAAISCNPTIESQSVQPGGQPMHPMYISSKDGDSNIDFDNIQSQILADALSPPRTNPAGPTYPKSSAIITSTATTKSLQPRVQPPIANTIAPTAANSEAVPRSLQPINKHSTATETISPRQLGTAFSDSLKNRNLADTSWYAIARQQDAGTIVTPAPSVIAINRAQSPLASDIDDEVTTTAISAVKVQLDIQAQEPEPVVVAAHGLPDVSMPPPIHLTLPQDISKRTYLVVTATSQFNMAPVWMPYSALQTHYPAHPITFLSAECGLKDGMAETVKNVSATFTWSGAELRLRRDHLGDDWAVFEDVVRAAWELDKGQFEGGCFVRMLLHVG
ncbi:MAG: hypothetical protein Q9209_006426 [Squamulea sp. 1 TL-2023]